ncbi:MAG: LysR family transcriptional regulator [Rhodobacteraceae bacterium]|nr:LysR family transcriptional regulator [Paracoccaceae bacterium]MBR9822859.1 LysR family transcriptional regulator [Paracoccaceae bacterium]
MTSSLLHLDRLRLRHLRLLDLIHSEGSLRAVAEGLNLTQPAVSQMVKDLERAFGVALVDRSARGAVLTAAGQHALLRARVGLSTFHHLAAELDLVPPTVMRVGTNPMLTHSLLPRAMGLMGLLGSSLRIKLNAGAVGAMMQGLLDGSLECYIGRIDWDAVPASIAPLMQATPLKTTQLTIACAPSHPLAGRDDLNAEDLLHWPWALPTPNTSNRVSLEKAFRNCGLTLPAPVVEMVSEPTAFIAVAREIDVLVCLPIPAIAETDLVPLEVAQISLEPIGTHMLTLGENAEFPGIMALRDALLMASLEDELPPPPVRT